MIEWIPDDMLVIIFSFLEDPKQLGRMASVSLKWKKVSTNDALWKRFGFITKTQCQKEHAKILSAYTRLNDLIQKNHALTVILVGSRDDLKEKFFNCAVEKSEQGIEYTSADGEDVLLTNLKITSKVRLDIYNFPSEEERFNSAAICLDFGPIIISFPKNEEEINKLISFAKKFVGDKLIYIVSDKKLKIQFNWIVRKEFIIDATFDKLDSEIAIHMLDKIYSTIVGNKPKDVEALASSSQKIEFFDDTKAKICL